MTALFWLPYVLNRMAVNGLGGTLAGTAPEAGGHSIWAQRAIKAHTNAIENLAIFAPIVLTAHVLGISNTATRAAVVVYFFARLLHFAVYSLGLPAARTLTGPVEAGFSPNIQVAPKIDTRMGNTTVDKRILP